MEEMYQLNADQCCALLNGWTPPLPLANADAEAQDAVILAQLRAGVRNGVTTGRISADDIRRAVA